MRYKVSGLEGALLDAAVARAQGLPVESRGDERDGWLTTGRRFIGGAPKMDAPDPDLDYCPSTAWHDGGQIIERERVDLIALRNPRGRWKAVCDGGSPSAYGSTPLIAGMRAYVASKLGPEVELP